MQEGALKLELTRGQGGAMGFSINPRNVIDRVSEGGAAKAAGLQVGDLVIAANDARLSRGIKLGSVLPKGGSGSKVSLVVMRSVTETEEQGDAGGDGADQPVRKRARADRLIGSASLEGVRLGHASRSHTQL